MSKDLATKVLKFAPGHVIISEGSPSLYLYIIKDGQVKVFKSGIGNKEIPIAIVNSGQYLGELALLSGSNHTASAVALTEVTLVQITTVPQWLYALTRNLADRLVRTNDVLRRNNIVDEHLSGAFQAVAEHSKVK